MIEWNDKYSVGVSRIDNEHKKFIDIINKAIIAKEHNNNLKELKDVIHEITMYALNHFSTEETFMIEFNYPEYKSHKEEHSIFAKKMVAYFNKIHDGDYQTTNKMIEYLKNWLVNHIKVTDKKYVNCIKENYIE
jgi:hemerythrin-like metal-binding domain